jgi:hypothetical protein
VARYALLWGVWARLWDERPVRDDAIIHSTNGVARFRWRRRGLFWVAVGLRAMARRSAVDLAFGGGGSSRRLLFPVEVGRTSDARPRVARPEILASALGPLKHSSRAWANVEVVR